MQEGAAFIRDVIANLEASKQLRDTQQPILYLRMQLAQYALVQGRLADCKHEMEAGREELEGLSDVRFAAAAGQCWGSLGCFGRAWGGGTHGWLPFDTCAVLLIGHGSMAATLLSHCCRLPAPSPHYPTPLQVDPQVSASVYYVASLYHKQQKEYAPYYRCGQAGRGVGAWGRLAGALVGTQPAGRHLHLACVSKNSLPSTNSSHLAPPTHSIYPTSAPR